jgi:hypothetical protein
MYKTAMSIIVFSERFSHFGLFGLTTVCLLLFVIEL